MQRSPLARKPPRPRKGQDEPYKAWIRTLPCLACISRNGLLNQEEPVGATLVAIMAWGNKPNRGGPTEAAHVGLRGMGQKCPDRQTIPLCRGHHREWPESHHRMQRKFWELHSINRDVVIAELNKLYDTLKAEGRI